MNVAQLIDALKNMPQDLDVRVSMLSSNEQYEVDAPVYSVEHFVNTGYNRMNECCIIRS